MEEVKIFSNNENGFYSSTDSNICTLIRLFFNITFDDKGILLGTEVTIKANRVLA